MKKSAPDGLSTTGRVVKTPVAPLSQSSSRATPVILAGALQLTDPTKSDVSVSVNN